MNAVVVVRVGSRVAVVGPLRHRRARTLAQHLESAASGLGPRAEVRWHYLVPATRATRLVLALCQREGD